MAADDLEVTDAMVDAAREAIRSVDGVLEVTTDAIEAAIRAALGVVLGEVQSQLAMTRALVGAHDTRDAELAALLPEARQAIRALIDRLSPVAASVPATIPMPADKKGMCVKAHITQSDL